MIKLMRIVDKNKYKNGCVVRLQKINRIFNLIVIFWVAGYFVLN
jgi:hypothetical protein